MSNPLWGNYHPGSFGWSKTDPRVPFNYRGVEFVGGVNARPGVAALFTAGLDRLVPHIPGGLVKGQCWGADRTDKDPDSFHLYGLALDLNAPENPQTSGVHPWGKEYELPANTGAILSPLAIQWGGGWTIDTPPDFMHIEVHLTPAGVVTMVASLHTGTPPPPGNVTGIKWGPWYTGRLGTRRVEQGDDGTDVESLQRILNAWYPHLTPLAVDGYDGSVTTARVEYLQRLADLAVDGIVGPNTYKELHVPANLN